ncbi:putative transcription initiation factor TFIID subunit 12 domain, histone-fold protein [Helianthus annuus]|uniref:Putative histone-fold protein n=1 Tax=Helianthus annuus TaxID=4232 RepID=A0A251SS95_HELAN|nr:transcription initiation factor TFIID subunit 12 [Helianthus annuus]KAF5773307.1 putative transcription initiation factor TFIID subunit 12 domain, histone-fold protein [Helianthus annuus]KAJ0849133.1 putative transcription factor Hap3/NF-YB family [Helianthus annuus]
MDQTPPLPPPSEPPPPTTTTTINTPPTATPSTTSPEPPPPPQPQPQSQPQTPTPTPTPPTTTSSSPQPLPQSPSPSPNPNPNPKPPNLPTSQPLPPQPLNPMSRPQFNRPYSPFPHFSSMTNHSTASSSSISSIPPAQRGGMALGVPAHPSPQPPTSFSSLTPPSFGSQFGGLGRPAVPDSVASTSAPQVRQSISGMPGVGMMGSLGSSSSLRASGVTASLPQRPLQSSLRPPTSANNQSPATQNFQDHSHLRHPSVGSPGSPAPTTPQNTPSHNQPWLSSGTQGKPPLPPASFRPQMGPQTLQQRSHMPPQQQTAMSASTQQPQAQASSSLQSQPSSLSQQPQEQHYSLPPSRVPQTLTHQQQMARNRGLGNQRPFAPGTGQSSPVTPTPAFNKPPPAVEPPEPCNRIISKRSIQEIVAQIDPAERLDPEVEDILVDIADDFVESVTTFACSLAKHRKSNTLESKDILLHLEKNWNMSLPGFSGDEIKCYKKPFGNDVHRERLAAIKKSIAAAETPSSKSSGGQAAGGGAKGHPAKAPGLVIGSPNPKVRETA